MTKKELQQKSLQQLEEELSQLQNQLRLARTGSSGADLGALLKLRNRYYDRRKYLRNREKILECLKEKWRNDPEWREKERIRKNAQGPRDNMLRKLKYQTDAGDREKRKAQSAVYRVGRSEYYAKLAKDWRAKNPERYKALAGKWAKEHPEENKIVRRRALAKLRKRPEYVLMNRLRSRMSGLFTGDTKKSAGTKKLVGCNHYEFKIIVEGRFLLGMTWENRSKWHLDHRVPCNLFDLSVCAQQSLCFHFSNIQPRWAADNIRKWNRVLTEDIPYAETILGRKLEPHEIYKPKIKTSCQSTPAL